MAITKIWAVHERLDNLLEYVESTDKTENPAFASLSSVLGYAADSAKTEQRFFVSGINCSPETAYQSMQSSYLLNDKPLRVLAYHAVQSFAPSEVTAEDAHALGIRLAEQMWGTEFQVVIATHLNTGIYHNHFVVCSTSFVDGHRYHQCKAATRRLREVSDALCKEHGISVIKHPEQEHGKHHGQWRAEREGRQTWTSIIKADVDEAIANSVNERQFSRNLKILGYEIKDGKDLSARPPGKERFVRLRRNLGDDYSKEGISRRIRAHGWIPNQKLANTATRYPKPKPLPKWARDSIVARYRHYLYLLGYYDRLHQQDSNARMHYLLREDIAKLEDFTTEIRILNREGIETELDFCAYRNKVSGEVDALTRERRTLYRAASKAEAPERLQGTRSDIATINYRLKELRSTLRHLGNIEKRSVEAHEKIENIEVAHIQDQIINTRERQREH
jgi:hypothetical protein